MSTRYISVELRQRVAEVYRYRCAYCLTGQHVIGPLLEIDHIIPKSKGGAEDEENLCLACPMRNSHKSARREAIDPVSALTVPLFNPWGDVWDEHFEWAEEGSVIQGKTPTGRATVSALNMNHPDVVATRRLWVTANWHPPIG